MSGDIIFGNLFDKINLSSNNINEYFKNINAYNTNIYDILTTIPKYNILVYILIVFLIFNFVGRLNIRLNEILIFLISVLVIYLLIKKDYTQFIRYTNEKNVQLDYLHKLIFYNKEYDYSSNIDRIIKPSSEISISYLYLNPLIIQFFYNIRNYARYNMPAYVNSLIHANNVIGLDYQSTIGIDLSYLNFQLTIEETKKSLNELNAVNYKLSSTLGNYTLMNDSIKILHELLNKHILNMSILFKNKNKGKDIPDHYTMPDNFYDEYFIINSDDTKTSNYMSVYNMY